jgi:hypothetical protein
MMKDVYPSVRIEQAVEPLEQPKTHLYKPPARHLSTQVEADLFIHKKSFKKSMRLLRNKKQIVNIPLTVRMYKEYPSGDTKSSGVGVGVGSLSIIRISARI